jgi:hypothetical protein
MRDGGAPDRFVQQRGDDAAVQNAGIALKFFARSEFRMHAPVVVQNKVQVQADRVLAPAHETHLTRRLLAHRLPRRLDRKCAPVL